MRKTRSGNRHRRRGPLLVVALVLACALAYLLRVGPGLMLPGTSVGAAQIGPRAWDEAVAPNYYEVVGPAVAEHALEEGTVQYGSLDMLGRAGKVEACVDVELMEASSKREREDMQDLHPSGWGQNEKLPIECPDGKTYNGYFWNRSHLLAKSLGGEEIIENIVCGTRMQNVGGNVNGSEGGMAYTESLAREWLARNPEGSVYYAATPVYEGAEPLCRNVVVDVLSSDGSLNMEVVVYNAAKGYDINYATGDVS